LCFGIATVNQFRLVAFNGYAAFARFQLAGIANRLGFVLENLSCRLKPAELRTQIIRTPLNKFNLEMA